MPIGLIGGTRAKSDTTNDLTLNILAPAVTFDDSGKNIIQYFQLENLTPEPTTFTAASSTTTNLSTAVTGANLSNVRVGDGVTGTGIAGGTTVAAVVSATAITLSQAATASGSVTLTFTPPELDVNLFATKYAWAVSGSTITVTISIWQADGTKAKGLTTDTSLYTDYTEVVAQRREITFDLDTFFTNARSARTA